MTTSRKTIVRIASTNHRGPHGPAARACLAALLASMAWGGCADLDEGRADGSSAGPERLGVRVAALDAAPATLRYAGYVDFAGKPVNSAAVDFDFALFPCPSPGPGAEGCAPLWWASGGSWRSDQSNWQAGWPEDAAGIALRVASGSFSVDLGAPGQRPLPPEIYGEGHEVLYLAIRIEGRTLGSLQKIVPTPWAHMATTAFDAAKAIDALWQRLDDDEADMAVDFAAVSSDIDALASRIEALEAQIGTHMACSLVSGTSPATCAPGATPIGGGCTTPFVGNLQVTASSLACGTPDLQQQARGVCCELTR